MMYAIIYVVGIVVSVMIWGYLDEQEPHEDHGYMLPLTILWPLFAVGFTVFYAFVGPHLLGRYIFRARRRAKLRSIQYEE